MDIKISQFVSDNRLSVLCKDMLVKWCEAAEHYMHVVPGTRPMEVYGIGHNSWGVQTTQKALAAYAVTGKYEKTFVKRALNMLRFNIQSHIEGDLSCTDGTSWGHTWISTLGINRMMHGVLSIWDEIDAEDKKMFKKVMISECEYLCSDYTIKAGKDAKTGNNMPESNIWNGAQLITAAYMFAKGDKRKRFLDRAADFFINGISVDSDANDNTLIYDKTVSERYIGSNFFDSYALNHHGYMNVGYMVICLSNVAMTHFLLKALGKPAPKFLYRHAEDLWQLVKHFIFPDGRLNRIGGDTRVRYCYCQDYLVPVLLMMCDMKKDPVAKRLLIKWIKQVKKEFDSNNDGNFISDRASDLMNISPLYYTRLEADRAVVLSMALQYSNVLDDIEDIEEIDRKKFSWNDDFHGSVLEKGQNSVSSFTWISGERPQGMNLPVTGSDYAEWKENLCGSVSGMGKINKRNILRHDTNVFEKGFMTLGCSKVTSFNLPEGSPKQEDIAKIYNLFLSLPDDATCITFQLAKTIHRKYVKNVKGTLLKIPNDIFNNKKREYRYNDKCLTANFKNKGRVIQTESDMVNIDDKISLISLNENQTIDILRPEKRQVGISGSVYDNGFLFCDEICTQLDLNVKAYDNHQVILNTGAVVIAGYDYGQTKKYYTKYQPVWKNISEEVNVITVYDINGKKYSAYVNLSDKKHIFNKNITLPEKSATLYKDNTILSKTSI